MRGGADTQQEKRALLRVGVTLCGRYRVARLIGIGAMGAVYAGTHRNGHPVAIKILHETFLPGSTLEQRFRREALIANSVGHPGAVPVTDDDVTSEGWVFLVMPLLEGETLRGRADRMRGTLPLAEVLVIAHALLDTLAAAHAKRIVHRDVKPENLFITSHGEIRLLDFGIGRFFDKDDHAITGAGTAVGTPAFMAPEQARGRADEVDGRADIWAVGATMFTLLTGRFVHQPSGAMGMVLRVATQPAQLLSQVAPEVPAGLSAVIDRALCFDREDRWASASEMAEALERAAVEHLGSRIAQLPRLDVPYVDTSSLETQPPHEGSIAERRTNGTTVGGETRSPHATARGRLALPGFHLLGTLLAAGTLAAFALRGGGGPSGASLPPKPDPGRSLPASAERTSDAPHSFAVLAPGAAAPEAASEYRAAIQLWRDAATLDALTRLHALTNTNPGFAAAHLSIVLVAGWVNDTVRAHYAAAASYRTNLTELQSALLEASLSRSHPYDFRSVWS